MKRPRIIANISVATRLSLVALLVTLISLGVTAVVGLRRGNELADGLSQARLVTVSASRAGEVVGYVNNARREVAALAVSPATADAIEALGSAYAELNAQPLESSSAELTDYYLTTLVPELEAVRGTQVGVTTLLPTQAAAVRLQTAYTVPKPSAPDGPLTSPALVINGGDGSTYTDLHVELHPVYGGIAVTAGFDDLFLIDAHNDTIVYSVRKRSDFATSLRVGPLSGSALANLIDGIEQGAQSGSSHVADFSAYPPVGDQPIAFVASPVVAPGGDVVGYVAAGLSTATLDSMLAGSHAWANLGDSGETYLAGQDGTMRTDARPFIEDPAAFLDEPDPESSDTTALTDDQRRRIEETGTTALVQPVNRQVLTAAATGPGVVETVNYRGDSVLTSYRPVDVEGVDWVVFTDLGTAESGRALEGYARDMLFAIALFVVGVTFIAVGWANRIMAPVRAIASRIRAVRAGSESVDARLELPARSPDEYAALSDNIDDMLRRLGDRRAEMAARSEERVALLREFLPATVVQRTEQGAGDVLDHVESATVTVLVLQGLGELIARLGEQDLRDRLAGVVDELDALAAEFGLERVKITGNSYCAVCGVSRPYLDHAARSVGFALAAREIVAELESELGEGIVLSCGVDSGPVSVGLTNRGGLVYDVWGPAVKEASELARHALVGEIAVSADARRQLPDDFVTADASDGEHAVVIRRDVSSEVSP